MSGVIMLLCNRMFCCIFGLFGRFGGFGRFGPNMGWTNNGPYVGGLVEGGLNVGWPVVGGPNAIDNAYFRMIRSVQIQCTGCLILKHKILNGSVG